MFKFKFLFNSFSFGDQVNHIILAHHHAKQKKIKLIPIPWFFTYIAKFKFRKKGNNYLFKLNSNLSIDNKFLRKIFYFFLLIVQSIHYFKIIFYRIFFKKKITTQEVSLMNRSNFDEILENLNIYKIRKEKSINENFKFEFNDRNLNFCRDYVKKYFDINPDDKYAILHVRDFNVDKSSHYSSTSRNANINNYSLAIKKLISDGFKVIRLGHSDSSKNNFSNSFDSLNYFEYCFSDKKLSIIDIYLIKNSKLILGTQSGVVECGYLFPNIKVLLTNMSPYTMYWSPRKKNDLGIFKNVFLDNKILSMKDQINYFQKKFFYNNYDFKEQLVENTPEEILLLLKEGLNNNITNKQLSLNKYKNLNFLKKLKTLKNKNLISKSNYKKLYFHYILPEGMIADFQIK